jgi:Fe-S oxidoreductase
MMNPSLPETLVFLALVSLSLAMFYRRVAPVIRTILKSKRDPGFQLDPISKRVKDFVWEVLLQGKVIKERPLPGLAHAFVFWGFCAFALVTLNHFSEGTGFELLSRGSLLGKVYFRAAAVFAVAVFVSILGLAFRRFVIRPKWLGHLSIESGVIALLIAALMATYLIAFRVPPDSLAGHVNWWAHTLSLLIFLPLIPKTKHLHLALSPVTIFLTRGSFAKIPPLVGDEDFGIDTGKDVSDIVALQAFSCVECGRCTQHCPANNTGKELNPKEIALGVRQYLRDHGANGVDPLVGPYILDKMLWQCTTCGACEYQCPVGIEHLPIIIGLRRAQVNTGKWEDEYGAKLFLALEKNGNSLGMAASERDKFIQKNNLPLYDGTQDYCLWLGCMGAYDPQGREIILSLVRVMDFLGVTYGVLKRERCTGDPVRRLGNDYLFTELAQQNLEQLKANNVTKLLSICPHCVRTIGEDWKEVQADVQIEHHSEFLSRNLARLPQGDENRERIVFHDPCYLGRYRGLYDEPREIIERSAHLVDPPRTRERSFCCGAGGGMMFLGEEKGKRVNVERAEELASTGAPVVGAACPFCNSMFRDALAQTQNQPKLMDIAQIAAASLPK